MPHEEKIIIPKDYTPRGGGATGLPNGQANVMPSEITVIYASEITPEPIDWIWYGWLAKSKLHLIGGAPEAGKTTIALSLAAAISAGNYWPDGTRATAGNVLIWTSEDGLADTVVPRLMRMGAHLPRIAIVRQARPSTGASRPFNPSIDMPSLGAKAAEIGDVSLLILDPVVAAIPLTRNSHNNAETRNGLQPVVDFAEAVGCAVIGITHFTKGTSGKDPVERMTGSVAFGALPRIVMAAAKSAGGADDEPPRILVRAKSNIGPSGGGFGYDLEAAPLYERPDILATRIVWLQPLDGTARELLDDAEGEDPKTDSKTEQANRFLKTALANGERPATAIHDEANAEGIAKKTLHRAAGGIHKRQSNGRWLWSLR